MSAKPFDGTTAFGTFLDNLHRCSEEDLWAMFVLYAILFRGIAGNDIWFFTNRRFRSIVRRRAGSLLVESGALIPLRRNTQPSYRAFLESAWSAQNRHAELTYEPDFADALDAMCGDRVVPFNFADVSSAYATMQDRLFVPDVLAKLGASPETIRVVMDLVKNDRTNVPDFYTNTYVFRDVQPKVAKQVGEAQGQLIMDAARGIYGMGVPVSLGSGTAGKPDDEGHRVLQIIGDSKHTMETLDASPIGEIRDAVFTATFKDPLVHWFLKKSTRMQMTVEDLVEARSHSERETYLDLLKRYFENRCAERWESLKVALEIYLSKTARTLIERWIHEGRFGNDVQDGKVVVTADNNLRIETPEQPVLLTGLASTETAARTIVDAKPELMIVGRTITTFDPMVGSGEGQTGGRIISLSGSNDRGGTRGSGTSARIYSFSGSVRRRLAA